MIVFFGSRQYGKVDHVPGLFYVATNFFYVQFVPLFPTGSVLVLDDGSQRGMKLGLHGKSVLFGYFRAATIVGGVAALIFGVIGIAERDMETGGILVGLGLLGVLLFLLSYKFGKASPTRAVELAGRAGISPEIVARFFVDGKLNPDDFRIADDEEVREVLPAHEDESPPSRRRYRDDDDPYVRRNAT